MKISQPQIKTGIIYMIGPIGNGHTQTDEKMLNNVQQAYPILKELMLKGWGVICPMLTYFPWKYWRDVENFNMPWEKWMAMDEHYVDTADALFRLTEDKYGSSKGADIEEKYADKIGKVVFHSLDEVPEITKDLRLIKHD